MSNKTDGTQLVHIQLPIVQLNDSGVHQELGRILTRPHELIPSVVSCCERHKSATTMHWAHDAFYDTVGTDEVTQSPIDFTSLVPSGNHVMSRLSQYISSARPVPSNPRFMSR